MTVEHQLNNYIAEQLCVYADIAVVPQDKTALREQVLLKHTETRTNKNTLKAEIKQFKAKEGEDLIADLCARLRKDSAKYRKLAKLKTVSVSNLEQELEDVRKVIPGSRGALKKVFAEIAARLEGDLEFERGRLGFAKHRVSINNDMIREIKAGCEDRKGPFTP